MNQLAYGAGNRTILTGIKQKQRRAGAGRQGAEEDALLNPVQQARFLMYQRKLLKEARNIKGGGPGETTPFTPSPPREIPVSRPGR
jgi:hypothetical protein